MQSDRRLAQRTPSRAAFEGNAYWHGSPNGRVGEKLAAYGIHVGSFDAARDALNARIGKPADGSDWDGTKVYGETPLTGHYAYFSDGRLVLPEPYLPFGQACYSDGTKVPLDSRPDIVAVRIIGRMVNSPLTPRDDEQANGRIAGELTRGHARSGYHYVNDSEDEGSLSAAVPSRAHLQTYEDYVAAPAGALGSGPSDPYLGLRQPNGDAGKDVNFRGLTGARPTRLPRPGNGWVR